MKHIVILLLIFFIIIGIFISFFVSSIFLFIFSDKLTEMSQESCHSECLTCIPPTDPVLGPSRNDCTSCWSGFELYDVDENGRGLCINSSLSLPGSGQTLDQNEPCEDSTTWRHRNSPTFTCQIVALNPDSRCLNPNNINTEGVHASDACPVACGRCP